MKSPFKYYFVFVTFSLFIGTMLEHTDAQIGSVLLAGFEEAIFPGANDPLSDNGNTYGLSDEEIEDRIQSRLEVSPFVNGNIMVKVEYGFAILSGYVQDRDDMADAEEIAYDSGATNVKNRLQIREFREHPWRNMPDQELKEAVEDELYWSPFVNSVPIRVEAQNGIVTLFGRVENRGEIADAVENAYEAGAKNVRIRLWIDPTLD